MGVTAEGGDQERNRSSGGGEQTPMTGTEGEENRERRGAPSTTALLEDEADHLVRQFEGQGVGGGL